MGENCEGLLTSRSLPTRLQALFCQLERFEHGPGLVYRLLVFLCGDRIGDDAGASLEVGEAVFDEHGADDDAGVEIAGEIEIEDGAAVEAASRGFELVDNLHSADLGRA